MALDEESPPHRQLHRGHRLQHQADGLAEFDGEAEDEVVEAPGLGEGCPNSSRSFSEMPDNSAATLAIRSITSARTADNCSTSASVSFGSTQQKMQSCSRKASRFRFCRPRCSVMNFFSNSVRSRAVIPRRTTAPPNSGIGT